MDYLLVEPDFPKATKSKNHKDFLPIGLLKLATLLEMEGNNVQLARGNLSKREIGLKPSEIWVTSLFTYWIGDVKRSVEHYKKLFPDTKIIVGGIAASLFGKKKTKELTGCHDVVLGVVKEAENVPAKLLEKTFDRFVPDVDFQILHAQRGCIRKCPFCGTWRIEPKLIYEETIKDKIFKPKIVFYDNNFFANENIDEILNELIELKKSRKIVWCESQSGFDGRLLIESSDLPVKLKKAGFRNVRIAWDWGYKEKDKIKKQIEIITKGGYKPREIFTFVLYNWDISFEEMEKKRVQCFKWGVQIADCRYRPLDQEFDNYNPRSRTQTNRDYHIHEEKGWTDYTVKQFRSNVRKQNICIRHDLTFYSSELERHKELSHIGTELKNAKTKEKKRKILEKNKIEYFDPSIPMTTKLVDKLWDLDKQKRLTEFFDEE